MEAAKLYGPAAVNFLFTTGGIFWLRSSHSALAERVGKLEKEKEDLSKAVEAMARDLSAIITHLGGRRPTQTLESQPQVTPPASPAPPAASPSPARSSSSEEDLDEELDQLLSSEPTGEKPSKPKTKSRASGSAKKKSNP